jgi:hypothetical protein
MVEAKGCWANSMAAIEEEVGGHGGGARQPRMSRRWPANKTQDDLHGELKEKDRER